MYDADRAAETDDGLVLRARWLSWSCLALDVDIDGVHFVAVPTERAPDGPVKSFGAYTANLEVIADWLSECIRRVAENEVIRFIKCKSIIPDHARYNAQ